MAFQTFNGVYGPITPTFFSQASAGLTGLDPMVAYGPMGLPPMPGTPAADEMKHAGKKHGHKGFWGTLLTVGLLVGGGFAAWKLGADKLINAGLNAIKEKGFFPAISSGVSSLWGRLRGMTWQGFTEGFKGKTASVTNWIKGIFKRPPNPASVASSVTSGG